MTLSTDHYVSRIDPPKTLALLRFDEVELRSVEWLWPGRFPLGKMSILAGVQGVGKSHVTVDMAARLSRGWGWPDSREREQEPGSTIFLALEDDPGDTIKPRLLAAGADESRVHVVGNARDREDEERPFDLSRDLLALAGWIEHIGDVRLLVIDPIMGYLDRRTNANADAEVRRFLMPVAQLAQQFGLAVVATMHLKKGVETEAVFKVGGSVAFTSLARAAWAVGKDPGDEGLRVLAPLKMNLARPAPSLRFEIKDGTGGSAHIAWDAGPCNVSVDDLFAPREYGGGENRQQARDLILSLLREGPRPATEMEAEREAADIPERTWNRAKKDLGAVSFRDEGGWQWRLP